MATIEQVGGPVQDNAGAPFPQSGPAPGVPERAQQSGMTTRHTTGNRKARTTTSEPLSIHAAQAYHKPGQTL